MQERHPDIPIESKIDTGMHKPGFDRYVVLKKLLNVFFDNIYKHSKAKKIEFSANENDNLFTFELYDNGIGLKDDYMKGKEWYTGINRAKELIFIVNGTLKIDGSKGTRITFTFKNE
jgi:two-component system sensor histidine kinase DegS